MILFLIFIIIPLIELSLFSIIGDELGLGMTLILCFITALIGGFIVRHQGIDTLIKGQSAMREGYLPIEELFDGFCIVIAGAMLFTPGFFTDTLGFILLIPPIRPILRQELAKHMNIMTAQHHEQAHKPNNPDIIDGEYERVNDEQDRNIDHKP